MKTTIVIQFAISRDLGTSEELDRRHNMERLFDKALTERRLGHCDGGQQGAGSAEIFCDVENVAEAVEVIGCVCDKHLPSRIIACLDENANRWEVLDPPGGTISFWGWNAFEVNN